MTIWPVSIHHDAPTQRIAQLDSLKPSRPGLTASNCAFVIS